MSRPVSRTCPASLRRGVAVGRFMGCLLPAARLGRGVGDVRAAGRAVRHVLMELILRKVMWHEAGTARSANQNLRPGRHDLAWRRKNGAACS